METVLCNETQLQGDGRLSNTQQSGPSRTTQKKKKKPSATKTQHSHKEINKVNFKEEFSFNIVYAIFYVHIVFLKLSFNFFKECNI